jgi:hypothetical protein
MLSNYDGMEVELDVGQVEVIDPNDIRINYNVDHNNFFRILTSIGRKVPKHVKRTASIITMCQNNYYVSIHTLQDSHKSINATSFLASSNAVVGGEYSGYICGFDVGAVGNAGSGFDVPVGGA